MELRDQLQGTLGTAYALDHELRGGGMSRIFMATETADGRAVVVKVLPPEVAGSVSGARFHREIELAASLHHPHIVPLLSAGETSGLPYYTMPFVEGSTLRARLGADGALPLADALSIMIDVAEALAYAHAHGVVHRDIKPDNILLSDGSALVTDFGIAKAVSAATRLSTGPALTTRNSAIGTAGYAAPEQILADPATDHRADIYSFGAMAYEMLAGRPPFAKMRAPQLVQAQLHHAPTPVTEFRAELPPALAELVMRCLEKEAAKRPQQAEELVRTLRTAAVEGELPDIPAALLVPVVLGKTMALYVVAAITVALAARAAVDAAAVPPWLLTAVLVALAIGLPIVLVIAFVHYATRRAATESPAQSGDGRQAGLADKAEAMAGWVRRHFAASERREGL